MWGAAPRLGRVAVLVALAVSAVLGCLDASDPALAAAGSNWAVNGSADFDGDHLTDLGGLYRGRDPLDALWYAPGTAGAGAFQIWFGANGDVPVPGDYDGDGKTDAVIFRPSTGLWYGPRTGAAQIVIQMILGQSGDVPVPGDYDGDGKTDPAIWRPSTGLFFAVLSGGGTLGTMIGQSGDVPVPRDYDGDGKTDPATWRPSTGGWTAQLSGGGTYTATSGTSTDVPVPADYNGDGRADPVVFRASTGLWTGPYNGATGTYSKTLGQSGDVPIPGYYDNNLSVDPAVYRAAGGTWIASLSGGGTKRYDGLGAAGDVPIQRRPTVPAATVAPANTALPTLSGTAQVGQTLTATSGSWTGTPAPTYAYQWRRCDATGAACANISGATATTYMLTAAEQGVTVRVRVTATNSAGSANASSAASAVVQPASGGGGPPPAGSLISRGVPAFASSQLYPASSANDADYGSSWRGSIPGWIAYDLSRVPAAQRGRVVVAWYNDPDTSPYDHTVVGEIAYNNISDYTVQANAAAGGTAAPTSGWVTLATVTGNRYHSRTHLVDMTGYNWIRLNVTVGDGSSGNTDASFNMDVHDAGTGSPDSWMFYGDSITMVGMFHDPVNGVGNFSQLVNAARPSSFPSYEDGGIGGLISADGAQHMSAWLSTFPGRYVALSYGTNDANSCGDTTAFYNNYVTMVQAVLNAGKVPIVPTIPWARTPDIQSCGASFNAKIQALYTAFPQIVKGPDLWTFFMNNQSLISGDNLHPSTAGYAAYRQQWANAMLANVYGP